jgi:hypothetical protein
MANQTALRKSSMTSVGSTVLWATIGAGIGSLVTYYLDAHHGRRRRAYARDKVHHFQRLGLFHANRQARNARNHLYGTYVKALSLFKNEPMPSDQKLASRVKSIMGRWIDHPSAVDVAVAAGCVTIRGQVNGGEAERIIRHVRGIRGVRRVINQLQTDTPRKTAAHATSRKVETVETSQAPTVQPDPFVTRQSRKDRPFQEVIT